MDIYNWVNVAQKKIRFRRRRAKFREEIFRRYRCRLESLTAEGMDPETAQKTVMEELGDPEMQGSMVQDLHRQHWMPLPDPGPKYYQQNIYVWITSTPYDDDGSPSEFWEREGETGRTGAPDLDEARDYYYAVERYANGEYDERVHFILTAYDKNDKLIQTVTCDPQNWDRGF